MVSLENVARITITAIRNHNPLVRFPKIRKWTLDFSIRIITSTKKAVFYLASVCLLAGELKKLLMNLMKIFGGVGSCD